MAAYNDNRDQNTFFQFSDQLRLQSTNFSNLSIGDSIWSTSDLVTNGWKTSFVSSQKLAFGNSNSNASNRYNNNNNSTINVSDERVGGKTFFNDLGGAKSYYSSDKYLNMNDGSVKYNTGGDGNNYFEKAIGKKSVGFGNDGVGKKKNVNNRNNNNVNSPTATTDKKHKTLPAAEALPRNETIGGYIFVCNNDTMDENLRRELFGLPPRYRDSVRAITPGLPLFLYNYSNHQLHGVFEAASFGGSNIDPTAWEDKKCPGTSRFPSQVRVVTRKICDPLEEDAFRPILHHYDGPKFRLELNIEEALKLLDIFAEKNV